MPNGTPSCHSDGGMDASGSNGVALASVLRVPNGGTCERVPSVACSLKGRRRTIESSGGAPMNVDGILRVKGARVATIPPDATVASLVRGLRDERIGAMVVSRDGSRVEGIVSERDVVLGLAESGSRILERMVSEIMTTPVSTCAPSDPVKTVMETMTVRRIRHLPVVSDGRLVGIVSIGDVVKNRLDEMATETSVLREAYLAGR
jgi:CBS domain-containing protein